MAITIDTTASGTATVGTTVTVAITIASGATALVVMIGMDDASTRFPSDVSHNGLTMTELGAVGTYNNPLGVDGWVLANPASGTHNIVVTKTSGIPTAVSAVSFLGSGTPTVSNAGQADTVTSASASVTAATAGYAVDCIVTSLTAPTADGSQTAFGAATNFSGTKDYSSSYKAVSAGSPTMDWTFTLSDYVQGVIFVPVAVSTFVPQTMII